MEFGGVCPHALQDIELTFASGGLFPFKFTTAVRIAPETLPFGSPLELTSGFPAA
jgi:hypothetical protein